MVQSTSNRFVSFVGHCRRRGRRGILLAIYSKDSDEEGWVMAGVFGGALYGSLAGLIVGLIRAH